jgi:hypothetical protein
LNSESLLEAIFASIVSCIPDSDDNNSFPGVSSVYQTIKHGLERAPLEVTVTKITYLNGGNLILRTENHPQSYISMIKSNGGKLNVKFI